MKCSFLNRIQVVFPVLLLLSFPLPAFSQDPVPPYQNPIDSDFEKQFPREGNSELYQPDLSLSNGEELSQKAAATLTEDQQAVLDDVFKLAEALGGHKEQMVISLGRERIEEIRATQALPETNQFLKARKAHKLQQLNAAEFLKLDFSSETDLRVIGEWVYEGLAVKGQRTHELEVSIPGLGRAQPTSIDGIVFPRIVHEKSGIAFLLLDQEVSFDSKHLKQLIARIRYESNYGRGRPVVLLSYNYSPVEGGQSTGSWRYKFYDTPKTWKERAKTWWQAKYVAPNRGAVVLTAMSVAFQVGTTEGITAIQYALGNIQEWSHSASILTGIYGTVFGLWGSFYYNITKPNDPHSRLSRNISLARRILLSSATFAWNLQILNHGLHSVSFYTVGGLTTNLALASNTIVNNSIKDQYLHVTEMRENMGLSRGNLKILGTNVKRTQLERDAINQVSRMMKMADLMGISLAGVPIGSALFYSSYVWSQYLVMKYAQHINYPMQQALVDKWKRLVSLPVRITSIPEKAVSEVGFALMQYSPKELLRYAWIASKTAVHAVCEKLMRALRPGEKDEPEPPPFEVSKDGEWMELRQTAP